jgi:glycosyltransferase involved in cell wall biosynthesis
MEANGQLEAQPACCRVGYLISQYPAVNHTFILREIRTLRALGFDIRVVSIRQPDRAPNALSAEEADEYARTSFVLGTGAATIAVIHTRTFFASPLRYLKTLALALSLGGWNIRKALQHALYFGEAVIVGHRLSHQGVRHAHTHFASNVMLLASRLFPISFSMTIHGPDEFNDTVGFHMAEKVAAALFVATISHFASSQTMRASESRHWHKIYTLPLGVDPDAFAPRTPPSTKPFEILCVGRLAPVKAHLVLLEVIGLLIKAGRKDLRLVLVGNGPARREIEQEIARQKLEDWVRLEGALNHDRVIEFYRRASLFALASFAEGVPVVLMEAMAMEVPCVATWVAGVPELIRDGIDGLLVPPAHPEALASAIMRLMDDPALAVRLGRSGRERVIECYNLARNVERLGKVLRDSDESGA